MSDGFYLALGVTVVLPFVQWLKPVLPKPIAWSGAVAGCIIMLAEFLDVNMRPPLISVALLLIAALCVGGAIHFYNHRNDTKPLSEQPAQEKDGGGKTSNVIGNVINNQGIVTQGQVGNNTVINPVRRDANGIYQGDIKIGDAPSPAVDSAKGIAVFQAFHLTAYPDPNRPIEYGDLLLSPEGMPQPRPNTYVGTLSIMIAGFQAKIVGKR